jgi:hypothetical protein
MNIVEKTEYIDLYDFSSLINQKDMDELKTIIKRIVDSGNYFHNSPKYQTKENLFARQESVFLKMRQSFIYSCFMFLGKEVRIKNIMAWSFMTNVDVVENRDDLWHNHHISDNDGTTDTISGIWYVHIPPTSNSDITGTEFCMDWPTKNECFYLKPNNLTWNVYPSKLWHRPGITDSKEYRFVFAADMEYYK